MTTIHEYPCPSCDEMVPATLDGLDERKPCPHCAADLRLDVDAELTGDPGRWVDHTRWNVVTP